MSNIELQDNEMNWDTFEEKYKPIINHLDDNASFGGLMFETFGNEIEYVREVYTQNRNRIWTVVGDYGATDLMSGFHLCNRLGYVITEVPFDNGEELYVINEDYEEEVFDEEDCEE